jgi:hypothetical protein
MRKSVENPRFGKEVSGHRFETGTPKFKAGGLTS